jgi:glycerol-3-phosphate dehydrogenase (NAD(P)+)
VRLWTRSPEVAEAIRARSRNPWYLTDVELPPGVAATADTTEALAGATLVIVAVPSEFFAATLARLGPVTAPVVSATKGFEPERHRRMSEVLAERWPGAAVAVLSGPTFAREVALAQPTAAVIASHDDDLAADLQRRLGSREFRLYTNRDVVGVEVGGATKNVIALATGLADGLGLGENARAALVTRGLAEITRLAVALGGEPATLAGLAGLGDLVLTATGTLSRNRALGMALARGESRASAQRATRMVAEGVPTVASALALASRHGVVLPIAAEVAAVLFEGKSPADALASLLGRAATREDARVGERHA